MDVEAKINFLLENGARTDSQIAELTAQMAALGRRVDDTSRSVEETRKSVEETRRSVEETRRSVEETRRSVEETRKGLEQTKKSVQGLAADQKERTKEIRALMKIAKVGLEMINKHEARLAKSEANIERIYALLLSRQNGRGNGGRKK